jgi:hypothetical protein
VVRHFPAAHEFGFADEEEAFGPLFTGADLR